jgi:hypothetical protein
MPEKDDASTDEKVRRSVARTLGNGLLLLIVVGVLVAWGSLGAFTLEPGQSAILLRLGAHAGTINQEGFHLVLPPPIQVREIVNVGEVQSADFGVVGQLDESSQAAKLHEAAMQTSDNNIVLVSFSVQFRIKDAFAARYRLANPIPVVRDAAQAARRWVARRWTACCASVGRRSRPRPVRCSRRSSTPTIRVSTSSTSSSRTCSRPPACARPSTTWWRPPRTPSAP